ncbi:MAG: hypothetical protein ABII71_01655 [Candidatus Micrarchaeota archaeon]
MALVQVSKKPAARSDSRRQHELLSEGVLKRPIIMCGPPDSKAEGANLARHAKVLLDRVNIFPDSDDKERTAIALKLIGITGRDIESALEGACIAADLASAPRARLGYDTEPESTETSEDALILKIWRAGRGPTIESALQRLFEEALEESASSQENGN